MLVFKLFPMDWDSTVDIEGCLFVSILLMLELPFTPLLPTLLALPLLSREIIVEGAKLELEEFHVLLKLSISASIE